MLSAGMNSHFNIKSQKTKQDLSYNFFTLLQDLLFQLNAGPLRLCGC